MSVFLYKRGVRWNSFRYAHGPPPHQAGHGREDLHARALREGIQTFHVFLGIKSYPHPHLVMLRVAFFVGFFNTLRDPAHNDVCGKRRCLERRTRQAERHTHIQGIIKDIETIQGFDFAQLVAAKLDDEKRRG